MKDKFRLYKLMQHEPHMLIDGYTLDGHTLVKATSLHAWGAQFNYKNKHVKEETIDIAHWFWRLHGCHERYWISTVFLGLDHNLYGDEPLLFETMIKPEGKTWLDYQTRCSTWSEAISMHYKAKRWLYENKTDLA